VESESLRTGEVRKAASAYLTYVALGKDRRPVQVPPLILETKEDIRRNCEAQLRREERRQSKSKAEASC
jgi:acyl-CoA hydrolase